MCYAHLSEHFAGTGKSYVDYCLVFDLRAEALDGVLCRLGARDLVLCFLGFVGSYAFLVFKDVAINNYNFLILVFRYFFFINFCLLRISDVQNLWVV